MKQQLPAVILTPTDGGLGLSKFRTNMSDPAGYASAGTRFKERSKWGQVFTGLGAAVVVALALIGLLRIL